MREETREATESMPESPKRASASAHATDNLRTRYIAALAAIGLLTLLGLVAFQWSLARHHDDARVVRVAERQGMLAQKIVKTSYRLLGMGTNDMRRAAVDELNDALAQLQRAHVGLQRGDAELGVAGANSQAVAKLFEGVESDYQGIVYSANAALAAVEHPMELHQAVQKLGQAEASYLAGMESIALQYQAEAESRVATSRWLQALFGVLTLAALPVIVIKFLDPALALLRRDMQEKEWRAAEVDEWFLASPIALLVVDATSLAVVHSNDKAERVMRRAANDFIGRPVSSFFDNRLEVNKALLQRIRSREAFDDCPALLVDSRHNAHDALVSSRPVTYANRDAYLIGIARGSGDSKTA